MKYVLDTNVLLNDPQALEVFEEHTVIIPFTVLEELDSIKHRKVDLSRDARYAIRLIEGYTKDATHDELSIHGVPMNRTNHNLDEKAKLLIPTVESTIEKASAMKTGSVKTLIESTVPDDKIILAALVEGATLITRDINMRIKALAYGVEVEDYRNDIVLKDSDMVHSGKHIIDGSFWDMYKDLNTYCETSDNKVYQYIPTKHPVEVPDMCLGDYVYDTNDVLFIYDGISFVDTDDEKEIECYTFIELNRVQAMEKKIWGITPRNIGQALAVNSILDPNVHLTVLLGSAGTGKTLITIATALHLIADKKKYSQLIFSKTQDSLFEDIGFLPGTEEQKVIPFCGAAFDALEFLHRSKNVKDTQGAIEYLIEAGMIQFKSLNFLRGRSIGSGEVGDDGGVILFVDEFQNVTPAMAKMILSRCANAKIIISGNLGQIDNKYITPINSGLTYVIEKTKDWEHARVVELEGIERSPLAKFVEENF